MNNVEPNVNAPDADEYSYTEQIAEEAHSHKEEEDEDPSESVKTDSRDTAKCPKDDYVEFFVSFTEINNPPY